VNAGLWRTTCARARYGPCNVFIRTPIRARTSRGHASLCPLYGDAVRTTAYMTVMFLSMGAGLVSGFVASMTGVGALLAPALMIRSCRAIVAMRGVSYATPNAGISGALGYLSLGDAKAKIEQIRNLVPA